MPVTAQASSLAHLATGFRALLFDAYGVLKEHAGLFQGVPELLARLDRPWWVVSNDASRSPAVIAAGYPAVVTPAHVVSSGLVLRKHLAGLELADDAVLAYLGPESSTCYLEGLGARVIPFPLLEAHDEPAVAAIALMDDDGFDWKRELNRAVNLLRSRPELQVLCPNPDRLFPDREGSVGLGAGSLAALLESALGRPVQVFGKPAPAIFELALERARERIPDLEPGQILMVGDTLATDIAGARAAGLRSALVLSGNETPAGWEAAAEALDTWPDWVLRSVVG